MKCPQCGKEMEAGLLYTGGHQILWTRAKGRWSGIPWKKGDVVLQPMNFLGRNGLSAWICEDCRKVVLDY